ncbi:MAG: hypothetical protein AAF628_22330 [Planctomycetota bacterium]
MSLKNLAILALVFALVAAFAAPAVAAMDPAAVAGPTAGYQETFQNLTARIQVTDIGGFVTIDIGFYYFGVLVGSINQILMPTWTTAPIQFEYGGVDHILAPATGANWGDVACNAGIQYVWF